jgi:hypothetical protein
MWELVGVVYAGSEVVFQDLPGWTAKDYESLNQDDLLLDLRSNPVSSRRQANSYARWFISDIRF